MVHEACLICCLHLEMQLTLCLVAYRKNCSYSEALESPVIRIFEGESIDPPIHDSSHQSDQTQRKEEWISCH